MQENYCQSCGMPVGQTDELYGTEKDGSKSKDYCKYCYKDGEFTSMNTMEEEIEICLPHVLSANNDMDEEAARKMMQEFFPTLKRWRDEK